MSLYTPLHHTETELQVYIKFAILIIPQLRNKQYVCKNWVLEIKGRKENRKSNKFKVYKYYPVS